MLAGWRDATSSWHGSRPRCTTRSSPCTTAMRGRGGPSGPGASRSASAARGATRTGSEVDELFSLLERSFSDCTSYGFELQAYDVLGDMAFTVGLEHTSTSVDGAPRTYTLRATQVYRREGGEWKVAHRHADPLST